MGYAHWGVRRGTGPLPDILCQCQNTMMEAPQVASKKRWTSSIRYRLTCKKESTMGTVVPLCVEVGARRAINEQLWNWICTRRGFSKCPKRRLTQGGQDASVACSYYVFHMSLLGHGNPKHRWTLRREVGARRNE